MDMNFIMNGKQNKKKNNLNELFGSVMGKGKNNLNSLHVKHKPMNANFILGIKPTKSKIQIKPSRKPMNANFILGNNPSKPHLNIKPSRKPMNANFILGNKSTKSEISMFRTKRKPMNPMAGMIIKKENSAGFMSKKQMPKQYNFSMAKSATMILGDRVTKKQKQVLTSKNVMLRYGDWDKDGVINGLDCMPRDPTKHGFWQNVKSKFSKNKNNETIDRLKKAKKETEDYMDLERRKTYLEKGASTSYKKAGAQFKESISKTPEGMSTLESDIDSANARWEHEQKRLNEAKQRPEDEEITFAGIKTTREKIIKNASEQSQKERELIEEKQEEIENLKSDKKAEAYSSFLNNLKTSGVARRSKMAEAISEQMNEEDIKEEAKGFREQIQKVKSETERERIAQGQKNKKIESAVSDVVGKIEKRKKIGEGLERAGSFFKSAGQKFKETPESIQAGLIKTRSAIRGVKQFGEQTKEKFVNTFAKTPKEIEQEIKDKTTKANDLLKKAKTKTDREEAKAKIKNAKEVGKSMLEAAKLEKDRSKIISEYEKYAPYAANTLVNKYKERYGVDSQYELPLKALKAIAEDGKVQKRYIDQSKDVQLQSKQLQLEKDKRSLKVIKKLEPEETKQRYGYLKLQQAQTAANIENVRRQRDEVRQQSIDRENVRKLRALQQRGVRQEQFYDANQRAFRTPPGEGLSVFLMDGVPNEEPTKPGYKLPFV